MTKTALLGYIPEVKTTNRSRLTGDVKAQIKRLQQTGSTDHDFTALWTPRRTLIGEKILEDEGVLGDINSVEWSLYFHSLEKDVLSMELNESFGELYLVRQALLCASRC